MTSKYLYHTGFEIITKPDITAGRKNADFGQGFYLSDDEEFSKRWARERKGLPTILNKYELVTDGLNIKYLTRNKEWFDYIFTNRSAGADVFAGFDVIIGPIANDTIYDTLGIITSGFISRDQALRLLMIGPVYEQTVIKTEKAAAALRFDSSAQLSGEEIAGYRDIVRQEEAQYQEQFARLLTRITEP